MMPKRSMEVGSREPKAGKLYWRLVDGKGLTKVFCWKVMPRSGEKVERERARQLKSKFFKNLILMV